jgi:hypothetical protein
MATTTPNFGWPVPTSTDYVKDGATAIEALGDAIDATVFGLSSGALTLVKTQTIGSGVSFVNVTDAFNTNFNNYRIFLSGGTASTDTNIQMKFGSTATGYGYWLSYFLFSGASGSLQGTNGSNFPYFGASVSNGNLLNCDVMQPYLAKPTYVSGVRAVNGAAGFYGGWVNNTTSYTDFTLTMESGTFSASAVQVYGYSNS